MASEDRAHALAWIRSQRPGRLLETRRPWITFAAADFIDGWVRDASAPLSVFEYGSGASTFYWLDRGARVVSVEHDPHWFRQVRDLPVDYRLVPPQPADPAAFDPSDPDLGHSDDPAFRHSSFLDYAGQIDAFPDQHFDVVVVDGRARPTCLAHAIPKARHMIVLDNADRPYYLARTLPSLSSFDQRKFPGLCPGVLDPTRTDVFLRPEAGPTPTS
jgi:hypothetical protein